MNQRASNPDHPNSHPDPLAPLYGKLPRGWECWTGVSGTLYARRLKSSPPIVLRSADVEDLRRQVEDTEGMSR